MAEFKQFIDRILSSLSISQVIGRYIELQRRGANFFARCPFHNEKTASFSVNDEKGIFHCFGCGESGNAITFIMKYKQVSFKEALSEISKEHGIPIPQEINLKKLQKQETLKEKVFALNKKAAMLYHQAIFQNNNPALSYLKEQRKVNEAMIKRFVLGYAPDSWDFIYNHFKNLEKDTLRESGLFGLNSNGFYDRFRNKIIFPIMDSNGNVVGFGSRVLDDSKPKYINSPETLFFKKKEILYGLYFALETIRKQKQVYVVEGYMDVIMMHQYGFTNTVATLGTAFGEEHLKILKRYAEEIIFLFDGDEAGQKAAYRSVEIALNQNTPVKIITLPPQNDPCDFLLLYGKEGFEEYSKKNQKNWDLFLLNPVLEEKDILAQKKKITELLAFFKEKDRILTQSFLKRVEELTSIPVLELEKILASIHNKTITPPIREEKEQTKKKSFELDLVLLFVHNPTLYIYYQDKISEAFFTDTEVALPVFRAFQESFENAIFRQDLFFSFLDESLHKVVGIELESEKYKIEPEKQIQDILIFLKLEGLRKQKEEIKNRLKEVISDEEEFQLLQNELHFIVTEEHKLLNQQKLIKK